MITDWERLLKFKVVSNLEIMVPLLDVMISISRHVKNHPNITHVLHVWEFAYVIGNRVVNSTCGMDSPLLVFSES